MNVIFSINGSKKKGFTATQLIKVEKAIALLNKVIYSPDFKNKILTFRWADKNKTIYNRFHRSNAMSNSQVWDCLSNGSATWGNKKVRRVNKKIEVIPCKTKTDYRNESWSVTGNICINNLHLSNKEYTPIHLASAIFHEYCVNCCSFTAITNDVISAYTNWTVPFVCGSLIKDLIANTFPNDFEVQNWLEQCNTATFNYFPPSEIWNDADQEEMVFTTTACVKVDQTIYAMEMELAGLKKCPEKTNETAERMTVINNCINSLKRMRAELFATSLDGSEVSVLSTEMPMHMSIVE